MNIIRTIDLWTEQHTNHCECFNGAFIDGFDNDNKPFDRYKIVKNCNCIITTNRKDLNISNKHNAIIFYRNNTPVRLMVINKETDIENCISIALSQDYKDTTLEKYYNKLQITGKLIDMKEQAIDNDSDINKEIDVGSCDRWNLLYNMLKGSYTEDDTPYGNYEISNYEFLPNLEIKYELKTDKEKFLIEHKCAFINTIRTRVIPIQENSKLTSN